MPRNLNSLRWFAAYSLYLLIIIPVVYAVGDSWLNIERAALSLPALTFGVSHLILFPAFRAAMQRTFRRPERIENHPLFVFFGVWGTGHSLLIIYWGWHFRLLSISSAIEAAALALLTVPATTALGYYLREKRRL